MIYYVDGEFVDAEAANIPITDLAVLRGYGVFDFLRTYNGKPFHLEAHVDRLFNSADEIGLVIPWSKDEVINIINATLKRNTYDEANVRIVVTGGESPDFITPADKPRLAVLVTAAHPPADHYYIDGAKIITWYESRYLPRAKSLNYISGIRALREARAQDAVEAIYVHDKTHALEGTTTNLFVFKDDKLITPEASILPGITRSVVIEIAEKAFTLEIRDLTLEELYSADEVFITASNKQVMPIVQVDDVAIGDGTPGERTRQLMALFGEVTGVPLPGAVSV